MIFVMKLFKIAVLTLIVLLAGASTLWAKETVKRPLDEVFDHTVIVPFDYQGKVFLHGQKTDIFGDYKLFQRNGRVLVPIRLMGTLAEADRNNGYWTVDWNPQKPDDVVLANYQLRKTVKFKVNSNVMYINDEPQTLDVPPQKIEGRIVLPLRSASEALSKQIEWLDGLIIISNDSIDLQNPQTLKVKDKIKARLVDARKELDYEKRVTLVARYGDTVYYIKNKIIGNKNIQELYKITGSQKEVKIELPGEENFINSKVINNELYYIAKNNGKIELDVFSFAHNKSRKLSGLGQWNPEDGLGGWLGSMKYLNNEFYIVLHSGDNTMGSEVLYKLQNGQLTKITGAKSFISFDTAGEYLYYTDFQFPNAVDNLFRVNIKTGAKEKAGEKGFTYGISRTIEGGGTSYSSNGSFFIKDGYIYTLGYKDMDQNAKSSVYKISLNSKTQRQLTSSAKTFWLQDDTIYYLDLSTGYLVKVDLEGKNKKTLVDKRIMDIQFFDGNIYYTAANGSTTNAKSGRFYKYNIASGQEVKLSDQSVSQFFVGKAGVYYKSDGYDLGLYKIDAKGKSVCLADDTIDTALLTDAGIVYTLRYVDGVYTAN